MDTNALETKVASPTSLIKVTPRWTPNPTWADNLLISADIILLNFYYFNKTEL